MNAKADKKVRESSAEEVASAGALAEQAKNLPVAGEMTDADFAADAGKGKEGVDKDSLAIPFIVVLQPNSPAVVDKLVAGAESGLLINSVTQELFGLGVTDESSPKAWFVHCSFQRRWIRWGARENGGGFKGEFSTAEALAIREQGLVKELEGRMYYPAADGSINPKRDDRLTDTRSHFGLLLRSSTDALPMAAIMALASSGIKRSKNLMSRIDGLRLHGPNGMYNPPSFSHIYPVATVKCKNDKGTWFEPVFGAPTRIKSRDVYEMAKAFHAQVTAGKVQAAHESMERMGGAEEGAGGETSSEERAKGGF